MSLPKNRLSRKSSRMPHVSDFSVDQLTLLCFEALLTAALMLFLFRLRSRLGLAPLYVTLGVIQPIQVLLASSIYVEIFPGLLVSPGSVVLFSASLFAVLLVYIQEDALEARKIIYGIIDGQPDHDPVPARSTGSHLTLPDTLNFLNLPREVFHQNARVMLVGTLFLFLDVVLIIFAYEVISRWVRKPLFLRIYLTLAAILVLDNVGFHAGAFWGRPDFASLLIAGMSGKLFVTILYAGAMTIYLRHLEPQVPQHPTLPGHLSGPHLPPEIRSGAPSRSAGTGGQRSQVPVAGGKPIRPDGQGGPRGPTPVRQPVVLPDVRRDGSRIARPGVPAPVARG